MRGIQSASANAHELACRSNCTLFECDVERKSPLDLPYRLHVHAREANGCRRLDRASVTVVSA